MTREGGPKVALPRPSACSQKQMGEKSEFSNWKFRVVEFGFYIVSGILHNVGVRHFAMWRALAISCFPGFGDPIFVVFGSDRFLFLNELHWRSFAMDRTEEVLG